MNTVASPISKINSLFNESSHYFPTPLQEFQFYDKYSRFDHSKGRRETWIESVQRSTEYLRKLSNNELPEENYQEIYHYILNMQIMPSMRLLAMAGPAAERNNISIYNCSFLGVDSIDAFVETLIISMAGAGVGFSVEHYYVDQLPLVSKSNKGFPIHTFSVPDSTEGWAEALKIGLLHWFDGHDIKFDYSHIRPAGSVLKTKGGQASGPRPLRDMLDAIRNIIQNRADKKLRSIDVHDIMCHIGNAAICGGMRRTAMISLFDHDDELMLSAKSEEGNYQRYNANNSVVWPKNIDRSKFDTLFDTMHKDQNGEPGIFNRSAITRTIPNRRKEERFGSNPCGEIVLRNQQFCNLCSVIARPTDSIDDLANKVRLATIIGTIQSMATDFPGLRPKWKENCDEERLLGVDISGHMDCMLVQNPKVLSYLKNIAIDINKEYADKLNINQSASITCVKPSGNTSILINSSSGLHSRWAPYYIRNVRVNAHGPIAKVIKDAGVKLTPENGQKESNISTYVVSFPVKSPDGAITRNERTAIEQCEYWLRVKQNWTEHNPSCTVTYKNEEYEELKEWVWNHRNVIGGLSFLPASNAKYDQMPYEEITKEQYEAAIRSLPPIDFSIISQYEDHDMTEASQNVACVSGFCEL